MWRIFWGIIAICGAVASIATDAQAASLDVCPSGCAYSDIQTAVNAAAPNDTIVIGAGTYNVGYLIISKPLTITGAGESQTIIEGGNSNDNVATVLFYTYNSGATTFENLTIRNTDTTGRTALKYGLGVRVNQNNSHPPVIRNVTIEGRGFGGSGEYGIRVIGHTTLPEPSVMIDNVTTRNVGSNSLLIEDWKNNITIQNSTFEGTVGGAANIFVGHGNGTSTANNLGTVRIANNQFNGQAVGIGSTGAPRGGFEKVEIVGNTITDITGGMTAISVRGLSTADVAQRTGDIIIADNLIIGDGHPVFETGHTATGIAVVGYARNADIQRNEILGTQRAMYFDSNVSGSLASNSVTLNRLASNVIGIENASDSTINAAANWWGCNGDPHTTPICASAIETTSDILTDTWVIRTHDAPTSMEAGETVTIRFTFNTLNTGNGVTLPSSTHELSSIQFTAPPTDTDTSVTTGTDAVNPGAWEWLGESISILITPRSPEPDPSPNPDPDPDLEPEPDIDTSPEPDTDTGSDLDSTPTTPGTRPISSTPSTPSNTQLSDSSATPSAPNTGFARLFSLHGSVFIIFEMLLLAAIAYSTYRLLQTRGARHK